MPREDKFFDRGELRGQEFETQPNLLDALGLVTRADRGPCDEHGGESRRPSPGCKPGNSPLTHPAALCVLTGFHRTIRPAMRDDYIKDALKTIPDPNILINVVSRRVKQLKRGNRPLVESLEKLSAEDTALREVIEGKISHELLGV